MNIKAWKKTSYHYIKGRILILNNQQAQELLARVKKGEEYLDDNSIPMSKRDKQIKLYKSLVAEYNEYLNNQTLEQGELF
jgi:hypothetical protein